MTEYERGLHFAHECVQVALTAYIVKRDGPEVIDGMITAMRNAAADLPDADPAFTRAFNQRVDILEKLQIVFRREEEAVLQ